MGRPLTPDDIADLSRWALTVAPGFEFETLGPGEGYIRVSSPEVLIESPVLQRFMRYRSRQEQYK